jgi:hypothetical protein
MCNLFANALSPLLNYARRQQTRSIRLATSYRCYYPAAMPQTRGLSTSGLLLMNMFHRDVAITAPDGANGEPGDATDEIPPI